MIKQNTVLILMIFNDLNNCFDFNDKTSKVFPTPVNE